MKILIRIIIISLVLAFIGLSIRTAIRKQGRRTVRNQDSIIIKPINLGNKTIDAELHFFQFPQYKRYGLLLEDDEFSILITKLEKLLSEKLETSLLHLYIPLSSVRKEEIDIEEINGILSYYYHPYKHVYEMRFFRIDPITNKFSEVMDYALDVDGMYCDVNYTTMRSITSPDDIDEIVELKVSGRYETYGKKQFLIKSYYLWNRAFKMNRKYAEKYGIE